MSSAEIIIDLEQRQRHLMRNTGKLRKSLLAPGEELIVEFPTPEQMDELETEIYEFSAKERGGPFYTHLATVYREHDDLDHSDQLGTPDEQISRIFIHQVK